MALKLIIYVITSIVKAKQNRLNAGACPQYNDCAMHAAKLIVRSLYAFLVFYE